MTTFIFLSICLSVSLIINPGLHVVFLLGWIINRSVNPASKQTSNQLINIVQIQLIIYYKCLCCVGCAEIHIEIDNMHYALYTYALDIVQLCIMHCTLMHYALYTCALRIVHLCTTHCILMHYTLYTIHWTLMSALCIVHYALNTYAPCTMHSV